jgi:hypothetical protein
MDWPHHECDTEACTGSLLNWMHRWTKKAKSGNNILPEPRNLTPLSLCFCILQQPDRCSRKGYKRLMEAVATLKQLNANTTAT